MIPPAQHHPTSAGRHTPMCAVNSLGDDGSVLVIAQSYTDTDRFILQPLIKKLSLKKKRERKREVETEKERTWQEGRGKNEKERKHGAIVFSNRHQCLPVHLRIHRSSSRNHLFIRWYVFVTYAVAIVSLNTLGPKSKLFVAHIRKHTHTNDFSDSVTITLPNLSTPIT
jgi:hypothetical protein